MRLHDAGATRICQLYKVYSNELCNDLIRKSYICSKGKCFCIRDHGAGATRIFLTYSCVFTSKLFDM